MAWLRVTDGPSSGDTFRIGEVTATAGRAPGNHVQLRDPAVSRRHVWFKWTGTTHRLVDLKSSHGVQVNGERVYDRALAHGDVVRLGDTELVYESAPGIVYPLDCCQLQKELRRSATMETISRVDPLDVQAIAAELARHKAAASRPVAPPATPATPARDGGGSAFVAALETVSSLTALAELVVSTIDRAARPDRLFLLLRSGREMTLRIAGRKEPGEGTPNVPPPARTVILETARSGAPQRFEPGQTCAVPGGAAETLTFAAVGAAIRDDSGVLGALYADACLHPDRRFTPQEQAFVTLLADHLVGALRRPTIRCTCGQGFLRPLATSDDDRLCICQ